MRVPHSYTPTPPGCGTFEKGLVRQVNTDKKRRNCFGFYAVKGSSVLNFIGKGNQQTMSQVLEAI